MKQCPMCNAPYEEGDSSDGYCASCGHGMDGRDTVSLIPVGATIANLQIMEGRAQDDFVAQSVGGGQSLVVLGDAAMLEVEAAACKALRDLALFPRFRELGEDAQRGAFLALSTVPPSARPLQQAGAEMPMAAAIAVLRAVLEGARAAEGAGWVWIPDPTDLYMEGPTLLSARLRVVKLALPRADASRTLAAIGRVFLPFPATSGPTRLVRMLMEHGPDAPWPHATVEEMHAELDAVEAEIAEEKPVATPSAACDPGLRRNHNEDAFATAAGEAKGQAWAVLVVCDGVSSSAGAEQASTIAAKTACDALAHFAASGAVAVDASTRAMSASIKAAHLAICAEKIEQGEKEPPGTTIVAALLRGRRLTVGWVGDSRAYWIGESGAELLTRDHSWVNDAVAYGAMTEAEALKEPLAHALTRCLGPLDVGDGIAFVDADVRGRDLKGPGVLVLCSDGLWNYFPTAAEMAELVRALGAGAATDTVATYLVNHALARGGGDNVTVAVHALR